MCDVGRDVIFGIIPDVIVVYASLSLLYDRQNFYCSAKLCLPELQGLAPAWSAERGELELGRRGRVGSSPLGSGFQAGNCGFSVCFFCLAEVSTCCKGALFTVKNGFHNTR